MLLMRSSETLVRRKSWRKIRRINVTRQPMFDVVNFLEESSVGPWCWDMVHSLKGFIFSARGSSVSPKNKSNMCLFCSTKNYEKINVKIHLSHRPVCSDLNWLGFLFICCRSVTVLLPVKPIDSTESIQKWADLHGWACVCWLEDQSKGWIPFWRKRLWKNTLNELYTLLSLALPEFGSVQWNGLLSLSK